MKKKIAFCCMVLTSLLLFASVVIASQETEKGNSKSCVILIPRDMDPDSFLKETEWELFSRLDRFDLRVLSADWIGDPDQSLQLLEDTCEGILRNSQTEDTQDLFLIGYEEGADFAAGEICEHTDRYAGAVLLGGNGLTEDQLTEYAGYPYKEALSVWVLAPKKTSSLSSYLAYWKEANRITGSALRSWSQDFSDELYLPSTSSIDNITEGINRMGAVLFSRETDYYSSSVAANISRTFISGVSSSIIRLPGNITGGEIYPLRDWHFSYYRMQYDGQQRDFWMYVPDSAFVSQDPSSLILCLHGSGGNGEGMIIQSGWSETARRNNCIVLFPSSLYTSGRTHYWTNTEEEIQFIRQLVSAACDMYQIDTSRIYVTGFSNGAGMADNLAMRCSDIFAAAALSAPAYFDEEYFGPVENVHEVAILFSVGTEDKYLEEYHTTAEITDIPAVKHLEYWRNMYGFRQDYFQCYKQDKATVYVFSNREFLPVCRWVIVEGKTHEYPRQEVPIFYDFLKDYTKGENGELYYQGRLVRSR